MADKPQHLKIVKGNAKKQICPLCKQQAEVPYTPFCSSRCAQLDLGKWLTGGYAVPAYEAMYDSDIETLLDAYETLRETQVDTES